MPPRRRYHGSLDETEIQINGWEWLHLFKYIKNRYMYIIVVLMNLSQNLFSPISSLLQGKLATLLVTGAFSSGENFITEVNQLANYQFFLLVAQISAQLISVSLSSKFVSDIERDIKSAVFQAIVNQDIGYFDKTETGVIISRITEDTSAIINIYVSSLCSIIRSVSLFFIDLVILYTQSSKLTIYLICYFPLHIFVHWLTNRKVDEVYLEQNKKRTRVSAKAEESLTSIRTVRSFDAGLYEYHCYKDRLNDVNEVNNRTSLRHGVENFISTIVNWGSNTLIMYLGGGLAARKEIDPGAIIVFLNIHGEFESTALSLLSIIIDFRKANISAAKLVEILERKPLIEEYVGDTLTQCKGRIDFKDVTFTYPTRDKPALEHLTFYVNPGETVAIVGESGCGKSTTLQLLERFYDCQSGEVTVDGIDIKTLSPNSLRKFIAYVPQLPVMFSMKIKNNIRYGKPHAKKDEIISAAKLANAHNFIVQQPEGYNTKVQQSSLSGGQKQRVCIARAVMMNAPIMLLDEATAALDAESERLVQESIQKYQNGRTMIIIAHRLSTVKHADRILVMSNGHIIEEGTHESLLEQGGAYADLVRNQLQ